MRRLLFLSCLLFCCLLSCDRHNAAPSKAAIDATLDREGFYKIKEMIWRDDSYMTFDLDDDSVQHVLFEEICAFKQKFWPDTDIHFNEFVDGTGLAYNAYCTAYLPVQVVTVQTHYDDVEIFNGDFIDFVCFEFEGQVNQDGEVFWNPGMVGDEDGRATVVDDKEANIIKCEGGEIEAEFPYRVYLPATEEFLDGRVLVKMVRK